MSEQVTLHKVLKDFLAEAEDIVEQLGSELADLADMADDGSMNPDLLNSIFRGAHSLKGLAGMFGLVEITELSHNLENVLDSLRMGRVNLDQKLMSVLLDSHELLLSLVRSVESFGSASRAHEIAACVSRIDACLSVSQEETTVASPFQKLGLDTHVLASLTEYEEHRLLDNLSKDKNIFNVHTSFELTTFDSELGEVSSILKSCGEIISTLPCMGSKMETHIDFDLLYGSDCTLDEVRILFDNPSVLVTQLGNSDTSINQSSPQLFQDSIPSLPPVTVLPQSYSVPVERAVPAENAVSVKSMSRTVRVDIGKLDELMNIVGELVLAHSAISGIAVRINNEGFSRTGIDLKKATKALERKLTDLQKGVMEIRMVPIGQLYEKMSRIIRKISRELGKKVELRFSGADTELDKLIVEDISDPLLHIIRNAIDHGIEEPDKRLALGKDEKGSIRVSSYPKGNHVVIEVEDDGNGIDLVRIKSKAVLAGLITDVDSMSDREAVDFIFRPGFSTNDSVSEVSGRGVGLDVVRNNIATVSGTIDVETSKGIGTRFIITLPITLAIIKALIIKCADRTYALPITTVMESLLLTDADIKTVERKQIFQLRDKALPLLALDSFFATKRFSERSSEFYVVVVGAAEKRLGIIVDELLGQQDIVIKSLGESLKQLKGVSGAADLGDHRTILVLDVGSIINETMRNGG